MLGQLKLSPGGRSRPEWSRLYGLPVLRTETDPDGFWGKHRLRKAGDTLRRAGALRVLVPKGFHGWELLEGLGLRPMETAHFLRAQSVPLALQLLERRGTAPDRATVALRGSRSDHEMARVATELCRQVRNLVIDTPDGTQLADWLRRELGLPVLPPGERGEVALLFSPASPADEELSLELYGAEPRLAGLSLVAPALDTEDQDDLPLLAALWEGGQLKGNDIKILDRM